MNKREEMVEVIAVRLAAQSGAGDQANSVGPYYRALAEEIVQDLAVFFRTLNIKVTEASHDD